jgi:hypothetical protein
MDCRLMTPIVHGLKTKYSSCLTVKRVNFHQHTPWHDFIFPIGSPEFALLDSEEQILYRWFGFTEEEEFTAVLDPLCTD